MSTINPSKDGADADKQATTANNSPSATDKTRLIIAALFLPNTVEFANEDDGTKTPDRRPSATRRPSTQFVGTPPVEVEPVSENGSVSRRRRTIVNGVVNGAGADDTANARGGYVANASTSRSTDVSETSMPVVSQQAGIADNLRAITAQINGGGGIYTIASDQPERATRQANGFPPATAQASTSVGAQNIDGAISGPASNNSSDTQLPFRRNARSFDYLVGLGLGRSLAGNGSTLSLRSTTGNEPQASIWGRGSRPTQPQSMARPPPAQDIAQTATAASHSGGEEITADDVDVLTNEVDANLSMQRKQTFSKTPWTIKRSERGHGGLYNAIAAASGENDVENITWVGTTGIPTSELEDEVRIAISEKLEHEHDSLAVMVEDDDFDKAYLCYCKTILWPVLHYQVETGPSSVKYHQHSWDGYVKVNQAFANRIVNEYRKGDTVWIQDYHLMLVPEMVRAAIPDAKIGFFMHVAFPSSEVIKCIAMREALLRGVLGANLIGFQTPQYAEHFQSTACRLLGAEAIEDGVQLESRYVNIISVPIGIDTGIIDEIRNDSEYEDWSLMIREKYGKRKIIASRDPVDQKAGMLKKLRVIKKFLGDFEEWWDQVVFIQIATPTTDTPDPAIGNMVTEINSQYTSLGGDPPIMFFTQDFTYKQWLALLSVADCMLVTSLREGMGLGAHEFIQCQDGQSAGAKHSPLVLSEFVGAATIFSKNDALHANPWHAKQCASRLNEALTMGDDEKEQRWRNNYAALKENTGTKWCTTFLAKLEEVCKDHAERSRSNIPRLSNADVLRKYDEAERRLFILDFEGTLASWVSPLKMSQFAPKTLAALKNLADDPKNIVYIASSRAPHDLLPLSRQVPGIGLIAENGCFVSESEAEYVGPKMQWTSLINVAACDEWKTSIRGALESNTSRGENAKCIERHSHFLIYFPKEADRERVTKVFGESQDVLNGLCHGRNGNIFQQRGELIVPFSKTDKATAANKILNKLTAANKKPDFVLVAGDDRDQEPTFQWAKKLARTDKVKEAVTILLNRNRNTEATATVNGIAGMVAVISSLTAAR